MVNIAQTNCYELKRAPGAEGFRRAWDAALDFAVPITFIALFAPALRDLAHLAAAFVSVTVALALAGLPYSLGLMIAATLAMAAGAAVEAALERRA